MTSLTSVAEYFLGAWKYAYVYICPALSCARLATKIVFIPQQPPLFILAQKNTCFHSGEYVTGKDSPYSIPEFNLHSCEKVVASFPSFPLHSDKEYVFAAVQGSLGTRLG